MTRSLSTLVSPVLLAPLFLAACGGEAVPGAASAMADPGSCAFVDPEALDSRFGGTPTATPRADGACDLTLDGTDIATIRVTDFDQAAYDAGVAELADALGIGNAGVEGKVSDDRSVAKVGDRLVTAERHGGDRPFMFWLDVVWDEVAED